ncbi:MAG: hypothetical protein P4L84_21010 [Isosphaeraceae bacterium]|nr:hypothetical protein [Isosphaeraceae bacterium]
MTLLTAEPREQKFLARFEHVWTSLRRYQVRQGLCLSFLTAALGLLAMAAADWWLELPWNTRAAGLLLAVWLAVAVFVARVVMPIRWWTKPRTAVEIEEQFPQLGQRIRTIVQFAGLPDERMDMEGVTPSLVGALEEETELRAQPLPLDRIVPWRRVWLTAGLAALPALFLLAAVGTSWEWRVALGRALLGRGEYTSLAVGPGDKLVEQGESVPLAIALKGRLNREVVLYTKPQAGPNASWKGAVLPAPETGSAATRAATLERVKDPVLYRVVAGPAASPTYLVNVRYPLALKTLEAALTPPAYTGVKPSTFKGGDLHVIEGTGVTLRIAFDAVPAVASLVVTDPSAKPANKKDKSAPAPRIIPLTPKDGLYTAELGNLSKGLVYRIEAKTADARVLPKNRYKIEVREDRPPRVAFEEPDEALEVHPIAEVMNRIRVNDDFGLTKAGIVFRFNNGEEQTLALKDFGSEQDKSGKAQTAAAIQEWLLLEKLAASPTDSLAYYAFAEDNYPGEHHRAETDLRYIDIRPFKREYKAAQEGEVPEGDGTDQIATLAELIARQRYNLNRGMRLAKHKPGNKTFPEDPLKIATFEETLANQTREMTEGVEGIVGQRVEPLHAAEESMLAAVEALDRAKNAEAPEQMGDALRHLIEARESILQIIGDNAELAQKLRQFDRTQIQKIRKPKKEEEDPEAIAERLEELAQQEDFVYATLAASAAMPGDSQGEGQPAPKPQDKGEQATEKAEPQEGQKADETAKEGPAEKGQASEGSVQGKGQTGEAEKPDGQGENGPEKKGEGDKQKKPERQGGANGEDPKDDANGGGPPKDGRREAKERQEKIADEARDLEAKLKKLDAVSDLAKARMTKAVEATEKVSGAMARGNTKEATETAKSGAFQLHELARQVKAEVAREVAEELAQARDIASELAEREAALAEMSDPSSASGSTQSGKSQPGQGEGIEKGNGKGGKLARALAAMGDLTDAERLERLTEAGKTLEEILKGASQRAEGKAAERVRDALKETDATEVVERLERIGALFNGGEKPEAGKEAKELAKNLEVIAKQLDVLHQEIVSPRLAEMVEFDRRMAELVERMKTLKTDGQITEWHRDAAELVREMEKTGLGDAAAALQEAFAAGGWHDAAGSWHWAVGPHDFRLVPEAYTRAINVVVHKIQDRIQDLLMKDLVSDRDEATPPEFKELVERYYEVLSKDGGGK